MTFTEINDMTGFANGEIFETADDVRAYFTAEAQVQAFGHGEAITCAQRLSEMAETVIAHGWHMNGGEPW